MSADYSAEGLLADAILDHADDALARTEAALERYAKALAVVEAATEYALAVGEWVQRDQLEPPLRTLKAAKKLSNAQHDLKAAS